MPTAIAWGATAAEMPTMDAATAVVARTFLITIYPSRSGVPVSGALWSTRFWGCGFAVSPECHETIDTYHWTRAVFSLRGTIWHLKGRYEESVPAFGIESPALAGRCSSAV
ncbi:hypothetical protein HOK021_71430 [Streptomyces hygroscopicus]|nr:hypothetical protein HOK021_71430 [Streptomyces hygroscopicus]